MIAFRLANKMHASKGNNFAGSISNKYEGLAGLPVRNQSCCFAYAVFQIVSTKEAAKRLILWASDFGTLPSGLTRCERYPSAADVRMCWPSPGACQVSIATRQTDSLSCRLKITQILCHPQFSQKADQIFFNNTSIPLFLAKSTMLNK